MIQRLKTRKIVWHLTWTDVNEPYTESGRPMLPTLVVVRGEGGAGEPSIAIQELAREIDQRRVERMLLKIIAEHGPPDLLYVQEADEWDAPSWDAFAREQQIEVLLFETTGDPDAPREALSAAAFTENNGRQLARQLRMRIESLDKDGAQKLADALASEAVQLHSQLRRRAVLDRCLEIDPNCHPAKVTLADFEFQRGDPKSALTLFESVWHAAQTEIKSEGEAPWANRTSRLALRALFGCALANWHLGNLPEAISYAECLLEKNPADNQGARFLLPLLYLLNDQQDAALRFFNEYETKYPRDYFEPAFLFGWGWLLGREDDETAARAKYRSAILRNIYIAPLLLDLPEPRTDLWHANDRSEPEYASEFVDSFGVLWERDAAARRLLAEVHNSFSEDIATLIDIHVQMAELQDQRYEPRHPQLWQSLLDRERKLLGDLPEPDATSPASAA